LRRTVCFLFFFNLSLPTSSQVFPERFALCCLLFSYIDFPLPPPPPSCVAVFFFLLVLFPLPFWCSGFGCSGWFRSALFAELPTSLRGEDQRFPLSSRNHLLSFLYWLFVLSPLATIFSRGYFFPPLVYLVPFSLPTLKFAALTVRSPPLPFFPPRHARPPCCSLECLIRLTITRPYPGTVVLWRSLCPRKIFLDRAH